MASRRGESLLVMVVVPLVLLVFFGSIAPVTSSRATERPLDFLVPGILALAVMSTSMVSLGIATAYERYYGVLKRLAGAPVSSLTLLGSRVLAIVLLEILQCTVVVVVARLAFGWVPGGSIALAILPLGMGSLAFAGIGLLMAGRLRAEATLAAANGLYLVFLLLGGFVFPVEQLPDLLGTVARLLPGAALAEATRVALLGLPIQTAGQAWLILTIWALVAPVAAAITFRAE